MDHLYITWSKAASQYAVSLDEIFLTLYGFGKKRNIPTARKGFKRETYDPEKTLTDKEMPGIVYRINVTADQKDAVRDILCDFLMESQRYRYSLRRGEDDFSSAEFIAYILDKTGIIGFEDSVSGIAEEDLAGLAEFDKVEVIFEGDLKKYVAERKEKSTATDSNVRHLYSVKKNEKVVEHGAAQYEYVPDEMKELMTAD